METLHLQLQLHYTANIHCEERRSFREEKLVRSKKDRPMMRRKNDSPIGVVRRNVVPSI